MAAELALKNLTMEEAVQYWKGKVRVSKEEWDQLPAEARTKAFFVAGLLSEQMQADVFGALQKALEDGTTFAQFKKDVRGTLEAAGWTAESMWKLRTIFVTNMLTAYSVGRYKQMTDPHIFKTRPYWQYDAVDDGRTRPAHRALDGKVLRADDPAWDEIYPPNGFNCRCTVRTLNAEDVKRMGLSVEAGSDVVGQPAEVEGRTVVVRPDEGFAHNPGKAQWGAEFLRKPGERGNPVSLVDDKTPANLGELPRDDKDFPPSTADTADAIWDELVGSGKPVVRDAMDCPVLLDKGFVDHIVDKSAGEQRLRHIRGVVPTIEDPAEVWLRPMRYQDGKVVLRRVYVRAFAQKKVVVVVQADRGIWAGYTAYASGHQGVNSARRGVRIYEKLPADAPQPHAGRPDGSATEAHRQGSTPSYTPGIGGQA
jgi:SPP1 gp7 family putative phage head morphogenesis protein